MDVLSTDRKESGVGGEMKNTKMRILVIDDEPGWRDLLSLELSTADYEVTTASHTHEALEFLRRESFDLVITDVRMPGELDGIDMIQIWRQKNPNQKVIFITGYAVKEKIEHALEQGSVVCLKKPFESQQLFDTIQSLLAA